MHSKLPKWRIEIKGLFKAACSRQLSIVWQVMPYFGILPAKLVEYMQTSMAAPSGIYLWTLLGILFNLSFRLSAIWRFLCLVLMSCAPIPIPPAIPFPGFPFIASRSRSDVQSLLTQAACICAATGILETIAEWCKDYNRASKQAFKLGDCVARVSDGHRGVVKEIVGEHKNQRAVSFDDVSVENDDMWEWDIEEAFSDGQRVRVKKREERIFKGQEGSIISYDTESRLYKIRFYSLEEMKEERERKEKEKPERMLNGDGISKANTMNDGSEYSRLLCGLFRCGVSSEKANLKFLLGHEIEAAKPSDTSLFDDEEEEQEEEEEEGEEESAPLFSYA